MQVMLNTSRCIFLDNQMEELNDLFDSYSCKICFRDYNNKEHYPNIICQNFHVICSECYAQIRKNRNFISCPFCSIITHRRPIKYRHLLTVQDIAQNMKLNNIMKCPFYSQQKFDSLQQIFQKQKLLIQYQLAEKTKQLTIYEQMNAGFTRKVSNIAEQNKNLKKLISLIKKQYNQVCSQFRWLSMKSDILENQLSSCQLQILTHAKSAQILKKQNQKILQLLQEQRQIVTKIENKLSDYNEYLIQWRQLKQQTEFKQKQLQNQLSKRQVISHQEKNRQIINLNKNSFSKPNNRKKSKSAQK